jgi:hypothetical protein
MSSYHTLDRLFGLQDSWEQSPGGWPIGAGLVGRSGPIKTSGLHSGFSLVSLVVSFV